MLKNLFLFTLFFVTCLSAIPQQKLQVLQADSTSVSIKVEGKVVAGWYIDRDTKPWTEPSVFTIESGFKERKVTYTSNRDSITFSIKSGEKYDFNILVKNRGAFPMRLTTYGEPVFLHRTMVIAIILVIAIIAWVSYTKRKLLQAKPLLYLGIISPILFWLMTFIGGFIHGEYNHLHNVVSELGAIGTKSEIFMSTGEIIISILCVFSVVGFIKACRQTALNVVPVVAILSLPISMFWAAIFPMHHELHGTLGPIPLCLNIGASLAIFLWRGKKLRDVRVVSLTGVVVMSLLLLRMSPNLRDNWEGLIQRLFYMGWTIWSIGLSLFFMRSTETGNGGRLLEKI